MPLQDVLRIIQFLWSRLVTMVILYGLLFAIGNQYLWFPSNDRNIIIWDKAQESIITVNSLIGKVPSRADN